MSNAVPQIMDSGQTCRKSTKTRLILTLLICFAFFSFTASVATFNKAWPSLAYALNLTEDTRGTGDLFRLIAYVCGAIACGCLTNPVLRTKLLIGGMFGSALSLGTTATLTLKHPVGFLAMQALFGLGLGFINVAARVWIVELWAGTKRAVAATQTLQFIWAIGTFASFSSVPFLNFIRTVQLPLLIMSCVVAISGLLFIPTIERTSNHVEEYELKDRSHPIGSTQCNMEPVKTCELSTHVVLTLVMLIIALTVAMRSSNVSYLRSFLREGGLNLKTGVGADMFLANGIAFVIGRAIGVLMTFYVKPVTVIIGNLFILAFSNAILYFFSNTPSGWGLWIGSGLLGIGLSTLYGNLFSFTAQLVKLTNKVGSLIVLTGVASSNLYPLVVTWSLPNNQTVLISHNLVMLVSTSLLLICLLMYVKQKRKCSSAILPSEQLPSERLPSDQLPSARLPAILT